MNELVKQTATFYNAAFGIFFPSAIHFVLVTINY